MSKTFVGRTTYQTFNSLGKDDTNNKSESLVEASKKSNEPAYNVISIESAEQRNALINSHFLCVIDNYTEWCTPCQRCAPQYSELARKYYSPKTCILVKEDADKDIPKRQDCPEFNSVPCFHFYVNGKYMGHLSGSNMAKLEEMITNKLKALN